MSDQPTPGVLDTLHKHSQGLQALSRWKGTRALVLLAIALTPMSLDLVGNWTVGQLWLPALLGGLLPSLAFMAALFSFPLAGVFLFCALLLLASRQRRGAARILLVALAFLAANGLYTLTSLAPLPFTTPLYGLSMRTRINSHRKLADAAAPIVEALHRYEREKGRPAEKLADLVPGFLPSLPGWTSRLRYYTKAEDPRDFHGNTWIIWVNAAMGMGLDSFVYFPNQKYPDFMYGGGTEKVGSWVYVHE